MKKQIFFSSAYLLKSRTGLGSLGKRKDLRKGLQVRNPSKSTGPDSIHQKH